MCVPAHSPLKPAKVSLIWAWHALLIVFMALLIVPTAADPDLWGHTRFGLDIIDARALPTTDPYSFTQDRPWVNHEWLSEVTMGAAYRLAGANGLHALKVTLLALTWLVFWRGVRHLHPLVAGGLLVLATWTALPLMLTIRPQLWTLMLLVTLTRMLLAKAGAGWFLPLFALWANVHGGWIVGLGVLGVWCAAAYLVDWLRTAAAWNAHAFPGRVRCSHTGKSRSLMVKQANRPFLPLILATLGTLITPYGWTLWRFIATTVRPERVDITEWQTLASLPSLVWLPLILVGLIALCSLRTARPSWPALTVCILLASGAFSVARIAALAGPVILLLLAQPLAVRWPATAWTFSAPSRAVAALALVPLVLIAAAAWRVLTPAAGCITVHADWRPDAAAAHTLEGRSGRVVTWFDWGQYAIWHHGPDLRVSLDGRRETVYSDRVLNEHQAVYRGISEGDTWLNEWQAEYVWLPASMTARRRWLESNGYRVDVDTPRSFIAVKRELAPLPAVNGGQDTCFP